MDATTDLLRVLACGSVDDGKSTLIGRLLFELGAVEDDVMDALARDSLRFGSTGAELDYALLVDGLAAEREQGVTIDLAYRFFQTATRRYVLADAPGHEQYTRNMATGASRADVAVLLVDARRGVAVQTRRHAAIAALMGVKQFVLVVNKMDLVAFDQTVFAAIADEFAAMMLTLGGTALAAIPVCARDGDNVTQRSERITWYGGPCLLAALQSAQPQLPVVETALRLPVQMVLRPDDQTRLYVGSIAAGRLSVGDSITNVISGMSARVAQLILPDAERQTAQAGDAVSVILDHEIDISRGDVLATAPLPALADALEASVVWMQEAPLEVGRALTLMLGTSRVTCTVTAINDRLDLASLSRHPASQLQFNEVGSLHLTLMQPLICEPYAQCRTLGGFILVDRLSGDTLGAGMVAAATSTRGNLQWQKLDVTPLVRANLKGQLPAVLWFTGLPASGKSTIANLVERLLTARGQHTMLLDGDNVRHGLNRDLGFNEADRVENIRRIAEVSKLFVDAGIIVIVAFISPYQSDREMARQLVGPERFLEIFVDTPVAECRRRDPKGHYARADAGLLRQFTGVDAPYQAPTNPELHLRTLDHAPDALAAMVVDDLRQRRLIG